MKYKREGIEIDAFTMIAEEQPKIRNIKKDIKDLSVMKVNDNLIGSFAILIGVISFVPIIYKIFLTKDTRNFTSNNIILALLSNGLWIYYGLIKDSGISIWSGAIYFSIYLYIMVCKILYK